MVKAKRHFFSLSVVFCVTKQPPAEETVPVYMQIPGVRKWSCGVCIMYTLCITQYTMLDVETLQNNVKIKTMDEYRAYIYISKHVENILEWM